MTKKTDLKVGAEFVYGTTARVVQVTKVTTKEVHVLVDRAVIDRNGKRKTETRERSMPLARWALFISPYTPVSSVVTAQGRAK